MQELTTPHIASPDVHVDDAGRRIVMYFHGLERFAHQVTRVATSTDGVRFEARPEILGKTYLRAFRARTASPTRWPCRASSTDRRTGSRASRRDRSSSTRTCATQRC